MLLSLNQVVVYDDRMNLPLFVKKPFAFDLDLEGWKAFFVKNGLPAFRGTQVYEWIFSKGKRDPNLFSSLSKADRSLLLSSFSWTCFEVDSHLHSTDGSEKLLLKTYDGHLIELVIMKYDGRTTLCLSSQVGCKMGCTFCQTGKMGLARNLSAGEILGQLHLANELSGKVTNVVFMGMGEPLDNFDAVIHACKVMIDPKGFGLSKHRVTVSTSGLVSEIERLGKQVPVRLAISLHSTDNEKRSSMMPVNRRYPLPVLKETLMRYPAHPRYGITFEYVLIENKNDSIQDAKKLVSFLHGIKAKVNLIPVNEFPGMEMRASAEVRIRAFQKYLSDRSIPAPVRYSKGQDISGGCGQLAAKREDELKLDPRKLHKERRLQKRTISSGT